MITLLLLCLLPAVLGMNSNTGDDVNLIPKHQPLSNEMIHYINYISHGTWKAAPTSRFKTVDDVRNVLGVLPGKDPFILDKKPPDLSLEDVPESFDAREKWSHCKSLNVVRDQSNCGSCWAVVSVEVMSDRICIHSEGRQQVYISAEDVLSCCSICGHGCRGGYVKGAWHFYMTQGLVTGGLYNSSQGCQDYPFPPCAHHINSTLYPTCEGHSKTPKCVQQCQSGYNGTYKEDKHFGKSVYSVENDERQIQLEIMKNGPVMAALRAYADFPLYKSGVYQHVSGEHLGTHGVKIIGWGVENGVPYWLVVNSWNQFWGDNGHFKILRGSNHCDIENAIVAGIPDV